METMYRVVNLTTNKKLHELISNNPIEIRKLYWEFNARKKLAIECNLNYKEYTSRCFEYIENKQRILVYTMDFASSKKKN